MEMAIKHTVNSPISIWAPVHCLKKCWTRSLNASNGRSIQPRSFCCQAQMHPVLPNDSMDQKTFYPPWFSVAPMMDWTDNYYRTLARLLSKHAWLYTEMVVAETIVHQKENLDRFLEFPPEQHPIVLQIGGSNISNLAKATELANLYCYDDINLNCGCPSGKVAGHGCFGVRLMLNPKALLSGLSPAENRKVPPLKYEYYFGLLRDFPELQFTINGGITSIAEVDAARKQGAHGVMVGRAAYNSPWSLLGEVDSKVFGVAGYGLSRRQILERFQEYADSALERYGPGKPSLRQVVKPLLNLFHSEPGNGLWKRKADSSLRHCKTVKSFLEETLDAIPDAVLDSSMSARDTGAVDTFSNLDGLLPPPYCSRKEELVYS